MSMKILTLSNVFPNPAQPLLGLFIRERMRHISEKAQVRVIAPIPCSPLDPVARWLKPGYRPARPLDRRQDGALTIHHPGMFCFPGFMKNLDGHFYCRGVKKTMQSIREEFSFQMLDAHFAYPDGVAAAQLARCFGLPFTITIRGNESVMLQQPARARQIVPALKRAFRVIAVSGSLAEAACQAGCPEDKITVVPNGVDGERFYPRDQLACRAALDLPTDAPVLLSVGSLVERKGIHRVVEVLPALRKRYPGLVYMVVGGPSVEGDLSRELVGQVHELGLEESVRFAGGVEPDLLPQYYSAADLFVLSTRNEGWCNAFLESLACGTPVVTTDVGGNRELLTRDSLGILVPFGDARALLEGLHQGLEKDWSSETIRSHGNHRTWEKVADEMLEIFSAAISAGGSPCAE